MKPKTWSPVLNSSESFASTITPDRSISAVNGRLVTKLSTAFIILYHLYICMGEDYIQKNRYTAVYTGLRAAAWTLSTRTSPGLSFDGTGISSKTRALDIMVVRYRNKRRILTKVYAVPRVLIQ